MLYIFGGLPATGKSTLASELAKRKNAVYLRIDTIEQALRRSKVEIDGPAGYNVAYHLAAENLRLGHEVIADSVNPLEITRQAWRDVAMQNQVPYIEIEVICSNRDEHRHRVETRQIDIPDLKPPTWKEIVERDYEQWSTPHILIDTSEQSVEKSISSLLDALAKH